MRIINCLEGIGWSGGHQQALFLCNGLVKRGYEVLLVCSKGSVLAIRARQLGLEVVELPFKREIDITTLVALNKIYNEFKPDIVNVHRAWAHTMWLIVSILKKFRGLIVTRRVLFRPDLNPLSKIKYCNKIISGYIAVSESVAKTLYEFGVKRDKICVVHSATDLKRFNPWGIVNDYLHNELHFIKKSNNIALMIANFSKNKGYYLLLEAFKKVIPLWDNLHLVIVGKDTEKLLEIVINAKLEDKVHILGFREDIPALISICDFTINASYEEGFAGTIRESASMGKPILASDIQSNREFSKYIPMIYFRVGNSEDLASKMIYMKSVINDCEMKSKLIEGAIKNFSVDLMVDKTIKAYLRFKCK